VLLLAVGAMILAVSGCGDGDSDANDTANLAEVLIPWGPSKYGYIQEANKTCKENWAQVQRSFAERYRHVSHGARFNEAAQNIFLPSLQLVFDDISYLGAPGNDKPQIEKILIALQLAVFKGQDEGVSSSRQLGTLFSKFNRLASQYDLNACLVVPHHFEAA
jgi:hypothetical protein